MTMIEDLLKYDSIDECEVIEDEVYPRGFMQTNGDGVLECRIERTGRHGERDIEMIL